MQLAQGDAPVALARLDSLRTAAAAKGWQDELLQVTLLQALAHQTQGDTDAALRHLEEALTLAEVGGFIRLFVDEGAPMAELLVMIAGRGVMPTYVGKLLAAFPTPSVAGAPRASRPAPLLDPLSARELEILQLIADGLSNQAIAAQLFLALDTVKGHNRRIFEKLQVQRRTEAVAKARALQLLSPQ